MKRNSFLISLAMIFTILFLPACAQKMPAMVVETVMVEKAVEVEKVVQVTAAPAQSAELSAGAEAQGQPIAYQPAANRLIIKNAEITLEVQDTDVAIDRVTQVVADMGGYIVSNQVYFQPYETVNYKYATLTFAVPVDRFEQALQRLRGLAVKVVDEMASGQDVTDEYVDQESRLTNLKATRDRIREFLAQAKTVDEALKVNQQLSDVESEIEKVQGRINYLSGRAAFSTITVSLQPSLPTLTPTPTPTATPTPTPTVWKPGETMRDATKTMGSIWRGVVDLSIWLLLVVLPCLLPFVLLGLLGWWSYKKWLERKYRQRVEQKPVEVK